MAAEYRTATMAAQGVLASVTPGLIVDGKWGSYTQRAFGAASQEVQAKVDAVLAALHTTVSELTAARRSQQAVENEVVASARSDRWISEPEAKALVRRAAARLGLTDHASALEKFLDLEATQMTASGVKFYDAKSKNGSSTGLMQMQKAAWIDAAKVDSSLGDFDRSVYDPAQNISAGVAYAKRTVDWLNRSGLEITADRLYLAHNQGLGHFTGVVTGYDCQSAVARKMIKKSLGELRITPKFVDSSKCGHRLW